MSTDVAVMTEDKIRPWWENLKTGDLIEFNPPIQVECIPGTEPVANRKMRRFFSKGRVRVNELNGRMVCIGIPLTDPPRVPWHPAKKQHNHHRKDLPPDQEFIFYVPVKDVVSANSPKQQQETHSRVIPLEAK